MAPLASCSRLDVFIFFHRGFIKSPYLLEVTISISLAILFSIQADATKGLGKKTAIILTYDQHSWQYTARIYLMMSLNVLKEALWGMSYPDNTFTASLIGQQDIAWSYLHGDAGSQNNKLIAEIDDKISTFRFWLRGKIVWFGNSGAVFKSKTKPWES